MGGSWSQTIMKDQRLTLEEAQIVAAPESVLTVTQALPGSVAIAEGAAVGDVVIQEYSPEVQKTVGKLIESVDIVSQQTIPSLFESFNLVTTGIVRSFGDLIKETSGIYGQAISKQAETSIITTELIGEKLQETQLGQASILPGVAKYLLIAVVVIIIAGKVIKK